MRYFAIRFWVAVLVAVVVLLGAIYVLPFARNWQIYWMLLLIAVVSIVFTFVWIFRERLRHPQASRLLRQGLKQLNQDDYENALRSFEEALRLYPQFSAAYVNRGVIRLRQNDYQRAFEDFTRAIEIGNYRVSLWAYYNRGMTYYAQKDFANAITEFNDAIRLNPKFSRAYLIRGLTRFKVGDLEGLVTDSNEVIRIGKPRRFVAFAYNNRAFAFIHKGSLDAAMADCNEALRRNSRLAQAYYCRGQVHLLKGNPETALADFNKAIDLEPDDLSRHAGRAITYFVLGQHDEAEQRWKMLIEKDAHYQDIDWLRTELDWVEPLVEKASKIVAELHLSGDDT